MRILTIAEAAEKYSTSEQTVRRWCREGRLDAEQIGRKWLIYMEERPARILADSTGQSEVLVTSTLEGKFTWKS